MITFVEISIFGCLTVSFLAAVLCLRRVSGGAGRVEPEGLVARPGPSIASSNQLTEPIDAWLENTTRRSGLPMDAATVLLSAAAVGVLSGFAANLFELPMPAPVVIGVAMGGLLIAVVYLVANHRRKQFHEHFPSAVEMIARSVAAGESLEQAVRTTAEIVEEPVASELERMAQDLDLGMTVSRTVKKFAKAHPYIDVKIFSHAVSIHREMGGRLAESLSRLGSVIRMRNDYLRKIESATSLGRFGTIGIVFIGLIGLAYMLVVHPEYIGKLWSSETGRVLAWYAIASELIGLAWVWLTLKKQY